MFSVGATLRRARQAHRLDLCTVAAQTKINVKYLEAIEADDRNSLPSAFFYKSFVDQYAKSLLLDTREIDAEIERVLSGEAPLPLPGSESAAARNVPPLTFAPRFQARRTIALAATLVLVVLGCSGAYILWRDWRSAFSVHAVIDGMRSLAKTRIAHASAPAPAVRMERPQTLITPPQEPVQPAEKPQSTAISDTAPPGYKVMLDLLAREATWLSVSSDGKPVFSGILQANQTKSVGGKQFAKMRVGNAAGIEIRLNGKLLEPLGTRGQVLDVLFTPDNFRIVAPPREGD